MNKEKEEMKEVLAKLDLGREALRYGYSIGKDLMPDAFSDVPPS